MLRLWLATKLLVVLVFIPNLTQAQGFVPCSGATCSACDFVMMANTIIDWLIGVLLVGFGVLAVIAGFKLVTSAGNPSALKDAKESFVSAFIGLLIILGAWIAVDTLIRGLGVQGMQGGPLPWSRIECFAQTVPDVNRPESPQGAAIAPRFPGQAPDPATAADAQRILTAAGVIVQPGVQLAGVSTARLEEIARLARECQIAMQQSCGVQVSSGVRTPGNPTGVGAHGGGQALDLSSRNSPVFMTG